jgi:hypothetical protein
MPDFPQLRTGVVIQYPARRQRSFATRALRFMDGTEQRFRLWPSELRQWVIRLELLTEDELSSLREFFRGRAGEAQSFQFTDPWDGVSYPHCTLDNGTFDVALRGEGRGDVSVVVRESR